MYLERFEIENIKCFAQKTVFDFTQTDGSIKKWNVILGKNGMGKSTLLQAIALTLAGPEAARLLIPRPDGWTRGQETHGTVSAKVSIPGFHITGNLDGISISDGKLHIPSITTILHPTSRTVHYTITGDKPYTSPPPKKKS